jgi:hypothetical protein
MTSPDNPTFRNGQCPWCHGPDEGDPTVDVRGEWWHQECAADARTALEEAEEGIPL